MHHGLSVSIQHLPRFIAYEATLWKYLYTDDLQINVSFCRPPRYENGARAT